MHICMQLHVDECNDVLRICTESGSIFKDSGLDLICRMSTT